MTNIEWYKVIHKYNYKTVKHKTCAWIALRFLHIAKQNSELQNRWLPVQTCYEAVEKDEYPDGQQAQKDADRYNLENFVRSISTMHKDTKHNFDGDHNGVLIYRDRANKHYYYVTEPGTKVERPKQGCTLVDGQLVLLSPKRAKAAESPPKEAPTFIATAKKPLPKREPSPKRSELLLMQSPWDSSEYKKLFKPRENETVRECLIRRIADLAHVNRGEKNWIDIVENHDKDGLCTPDFVFHLRHKCTLLAMAYKHALKLMGTGPSFRDCCTKAAEEYCSTGYNGIVAGSSVARLNAAFRENENFPGLQPKKARPSAAADVAANVEENPYVSDLEL